MTLHIGGGLIESRDDPPIGRAEFDVAVVERFSVHQDIARRIPEFVTEVFVAIDSAEIEANITTCGCKSCERKPQGIGTVLVDSIWKFSACRFFDLGRQVVLHHAAATFFNQCCDINAIDERIRPWIYTSWKGTSPMNLMPIMIMRATQKKMMSKPVTRTLPG